MRQINLLPQELLGGLERYRFKVSLAIFITLTVLILGITYLLLGVTVRRLERISRDLTPAPTLKDQMEGLREEFELIYSKREKFLKENLEFSSVIRSRISYSELFKGLSYSTHEKVWLTKLLLYSEDGLMELFGSSSDTILVSEFLFRLKKLPFFVSVTLTTMEKKPEEDIINFNVKCELR